MSYKTTRKADEDIIHIYIRGATDFGVEQAEAYHAGLVELFDLLDRNPKMARERTEFHPPVRIYRYRAHVVIYVEHDRDILIIRVLHGRQDLERYLR